MMNLYCHVCTTMEQLTSLLLHGTTHYAYFYISVWKLSIVDMRYDRFVIKGNLFWSCFITVKKTAVINVNSLCWSKNLILVVLMIHATGLIHTSQRKLRRLPQSSLVIALVPLKCSGASRTLQFAHRTPFPKEKMPWCPCPLKNNVYMPDAMHFLYVHKGPKLFCQTLGTAL